VGAAAIYALGFALFGINYISVVLLNLIASLALIYTTSILARRWYGETNALIAAAILACWPSLIMYVTVYASEIFFSVFVNIALIAWPIEPRQWIFKCGLCGVSIAFATYVRPVALLIPVVIILIEIIRGRNSVLSLVSLVIIYLAAAAVIAPWSVRNMLLHEGFVLISTNGGPNLWMGNNPNSKGQYMPLPEYTRSITEYERSKVLGNEARKFMLENPASTAVLFLRKLIGTHARETIAAHWNEPGIKKLFGNWGFLLSKIITQAYWSVVLLTALAGIGSTVISRLKQGPISIMVHLLTNPAMVYWAYFAILHAIIVAQDRYHFPSIPFIAMLSALICEIVWDHIRERNVVIKHNSILRVL
jgi:4-amino-4-deoxy-L-arabinose transferase-like glycosyltransferase